MTPKQLINKNRTKFELEDSALNGLVQAARVMGIEVDVEFMTGLQAYVVTIPGPTIAKTRWFDFYCDTDNFEVTIANAYSVSGDDYGKLVAAFKLAIIETYN